jgi:hypothetical protein
LCRRGRRGRWRSRKSIAEVTFIRGPRGFISCQAREVGSSADGSRGLATRNVPIRRGLSVFRSGLGCRGRW